MTYVEGGEVWSVVNKVWLWYGCGEGNLGLQQRCARDWHPCGTNREEMLSSRATAAPLFTSLLLPKGFSFPVCSSVSVGNIMSSSTLHCCRNFLCLSDIYRILAFYLELSSNTLLFMSHFVYICNFSHISIFIYSFLFIFFFCFSINCTAL